eukprot:jgi/Ulvmu1/6845/UM031_0050.1
MMSTITVSAYGWFDGELCEKELEAVDRWVVHEAEEVRFRVSDGHDSTCIVVHQRPSDLSVQKMSVGAVCWDGAFAMLAYLANLDKNILAGSSVVELGAGPGLPGLYAAASGARVCITDLAKVVPLIRENIRANSHVIQDIQSTATALPDDASQQNPQASPSGQPACNTLGPAAAMISPEADAQPAELARSGQGVSAVCSSARGDVLKQHSKEQEQPPNCRVHHGSNNRAGKGRTHPAAGGRRTGCTYGGRAWAEALEWGCTEGLARARELASTGIDMVLACDTCYIDPGDEGGHGTPCLQQFIQMCSTLMNSETVLLLAFEPRASEVRAALLKEISEQLGNVKAVPTSAWGTVVGGCDHIELYRASKRRL